MTSNPGQSVKRQSKPRPHLPGFATRYRLGVELSKHLEPVATFEEIGEELGITKQNAYTAAMLALGALGWLLRKELRP